MRIELIDNIEFGGIDWEVNNDYSNIYMVTADYDSRPMDSDQLEEINKDIQMNAELYERDGD